MICSFAYTRQLVTARERIATGLKKILETNELVVNMEVWFELRVHSVHYI